MSSVHGDNAFEGDLHLGGQTFQFPSLACLKICYEGGGGGGGAANFNTNVWGTLKTFQNSY